MVLADIARAVRCTNPPHIPRDRAEVSAQPARRYFELKYFFSSRQYRRRRRSLFHHPIARAGEEVNCGGENPAEETARATAS